MIGSWPTTMAWSPDLETLVVGVDENQPVTQLINLETEEISDLSVIVEPLGDRGRYTVPNTGYICRSFSPIHNYLTAVVYSDGQTSDRIIVFSEQLEVAHELGNYPPGLRVEVECPIWSADETMIYFYMRDFHTSERYFATYSLQEGHYQIVQSIPSNIYPSTIALSPDENHIAFTFNSAYGWWAMLMSLDGGEMLEMAPQWGYSDDPIWVPHHVEK